MVRLNARYKLSLDEISPSFNSKMVRLNEVWKMEGFVTLESFNSKMVRLNVEINISIL